MSTYNTSLPSLSTREILIADAGVEDLSILLHGINDNVDVWLVQRHEDAMPYIFNALADVRLSKLHLLAHGVAGGILLGNKTVASADFSRRFDGAAARDLDIAFWSCETGAGAEGLAFVETVANATGARVSATSGLVGAKSQNGSWELDVVVKAPFSAQALDEYNHVLTLDGTSGDVTIRSTGKADATSILTSLANNNTVTIEAGATIYGVAPDVITLLSAADPSLFGFLTIATDVNSKKNVNVNLSANSALTIPNVASISDLASIKNLIASSRTISYKIIQDNLSNLNGNSGGFITGILADSSAKLITTDAALTIADLTTLKSKSYSGSVFIGTVTAQHITDTATNLATNAALTGTSLFITAGTNIIIDETGSNTPATLSQLAAIDAVNGDSTLTYTKVSGVVSDFFSTGINSTTLADTYILSGKDIVVTDAVTLAQILALDGKNGGGTVTYTSIADTESNLSADTQYIYGNLAVKVIDNSAYSVSQLLTIKNSFGIVGTAFTGSLVAQNINDTAANLAPANVASAYISSGSNVTVDSSATTPATIAQLTALNTANGSGSLTYTAVSDLAANLVPSGIVSSYITSTNGKNVAVTDSGAVSVANLVAIDAANGNGTITLAGSITGSIADYFTTPTGTTFKDGVSALITALSTKNIAITDAATVAQAAAIYALDTHLDLTGGLTGIAANFAATDGTLVTSPAVATLLGLTTKPVVTITDTASIAQIKAIDTGNSGSAVNYTNISDLAANLYTGSTLTTDAATYITNSVNVLISDSASIDGLGAIDAATNGTVTAGSLTGSASSLASSIYVASGTNVTINDGSAVSLSTLLALNTKIGSGTITFATNAITGAALDFATVGGGVATGVQALLAKLNNPTINASTDLTVAQANAIDVLTTGAITATIIAGTAASLNALTVTGNDALTIHITDTSVDATVLKNLDAKTSVNIADDNTIATLTGTIPADFVTVLTAAATAGLAGTEAATVTGPISAADADSIANLTSGVVTATITSGTATDLNTALAHADANDALTLTLLDTTTATAVLLNALDGKTSQPINATNLTSITDAYADLNTLYVTNLSHFTELGNEAITLSDATVTATQANTIANKTSGVVTAVLAVDTASAINTALANADANDALTIHISGTSVDATVLKNLDAKTSVNIADDNTIATLTGTIPADFVTVLTAAATAGLAGTEAATVTGPISAADADSIANKTSGVVTATVTADTASALNLALAHADANDALTIHITDTSVDATVLKNLDAKTSVNIADDNTIATLTGTIPADFVTVLTAAATAGLAGTEAATVTGPISAADADSIANLTSGVVTATITSGTATDLNTALAHADANDALTLTLLDTTTATAVLLNALDGKTSQPINATNLTSITDAYADLNTLYVTNLSHFTELGNEAITLSDATVTATQANTIANKTSGVVTAVLAVDTASAINTALANADANDALTIHISGTSVDATVLKNLDAKTSVNIADDNTIATLTGTIPADFVTVLTAAATAGLAGTEAATVTGPISAADADSIANKTSGVVTATVTADTASALNLALAHADANDALTIHITDTSVDATVLKNLDAKTSVNIADDNTIATLTGTIPADFVTVLTAAATAGLAGTEAATVTGPISAADADSIANLTSGVVTATITSGTATDLNTALAHADANDALTLTLLDTTTATAVLLNALDGKTSQPINATNLTSITDAYADLNTLYVTNLSHFTELGNEAITLSDATVTATQANTIANKTSGVVTAVLAVDTASAINTALANADANDALTIHISGTSVDATVLKNLDAKTSVNIADDNTIATLTGTIPADFVTVLTAAATAGLAGTEAATVTGPISAADADSIANKTSGVVTATVTADTASALNLALAHADANDALTIHITDTSVDATVLKNLDAKTSVNIADDNTIATLTGTIPADFVTVLTAAATAGLAGTEAATVTGPISAADADSIANLTSGIVTATLTADTLENVNTALTDADVNNALTVHTNDASGSVSATTLAALDSKTTVNIVDDVAITTLTGSVVADFVDVFTNPTTAGLAGTEAATVTGTISAQDADSIAFKTSGIVTATITAGTASALNTALANTVSTDALTLTITASSSAATDLNSLASKTSIPVVATAITRLTGNVADLLITLASSAITTLTDNSVPVTVDNTSTVLAADLISIRDDSVTGAITATAPTRITGSAANVAIAIGTQANIDTAANVNVTVDAITTLTGSNITDLNIIDANTIGIITATMTGSVADLLTLTNDNSNNAYTITVTDTGTTSVLGDTPVSAADLKAIDLLTSGVVNASSVQYISGLAADIQAIYVSKLTNGITLASNAKITVTDSITPAQLNLIDFYTSGMVTATVSGTPTELNTLGTGNNYTITVTGTSADAIDLKAIDASTPKLVDATGLTAISGLVADVKSVTDAITSDNTANGINLGIVNSGVSNVAITISDASSTPITASNLKSIVEKTSGSVTITNAVAISGNLSDATAALVTDASLAAGSSFTVVISNTATASEINAIALKTSGIVTATLAADTASALNTALANADSNDALTIHITDTSVDATVLKNLDAKTSVNIIDDSTITTLTGSTVADFVTVLTATATAGLAGTEAATVTGTISAADADSIALKTSGIVTATLAADTASALNTALANADSNDALTIHITDTSVDATVLKNLDAKTSVNIIDDSTITTLTGSTVADFVTVLTAGATAGLAGTEAATVTGTISAANANSIALKTSGIVTATLAADTAASVDAALTNTHINNALTIHITGTSVDATVLKNLDAKTSVNIIDDSTITTLTGSTVADFVTVLTAGATAGLAGTEAATVTGTISAANANSIALKTSGIVTATLAADTAASVDAALTNTHINNALTIHITGTSVDATVLKDLDAKTTQNIIDDNTITTLTGSTVADFVTVLTAGATAGLAGTEAATVTGTISAANADSIANLTSGVVTATITAGAATDLNTALSHAASTDDLSLTLTDTTAATAGLLNALDGKTSQLIDATNLTSITDSYANLSTLYVTNLSHFTGLGNEAVTLNDSSVTVAQANTIDDKTSGVVTATIASSTASTLLGLTGTGNNYNLTITDSLSDSLSIDSLTAIRNKTTGTVTYTSITDTAANLATLSGTTWTANAYITSGKNVFVTGNIDPAELAAIDLANGAGTVTLLDSRLSVPNSYTTVTSLTPPGITTNNTVAKIYDAAGDQTFEIAAGGKLVLESVQGHNIIKFDGYTQTNNDVVGVGTLHISHSASTVIFTDSITNQQIASIAMSDQGSAQTITYSDNSHVELTLTGTNLALNNATISSTGTIL